MNSASKKSTPTKSFFQTPYKTTPTKTPESPTPSAAKVVVHAPVFIPKTVGSDHGKETVMSMETAKVRDGKDTKYTEGAVSFLSKRMQSETLNSSVDGKGKVKRENCEIIQNDDRNESYTDEKTLSSSAVYTADDKHVDERSRSSASKYKAKGDTVLKETKANRDENGFDDRMDDCTQNDDAEIFYCNLVEARKYQEELIKQKQKVKIQPVQGRLYRQKQTIGRWKLRDFVRALRQGCRQVR